MMLQLLVPHCGMCLLAHSLARVFLPPNHSKMVRHLGAQGVHNGFLQIFTRKTSWFGRLSGSMLIFRGLSPLGGLYLWSTLMVLFISVYTVPSTRFSFTWRVFLEIIILSKGHFLRGTGDARNPAPVDRYLVYPILYRVLNIPGGAGYLPSTVV